MIVCSSKIGYLQPHNTFQVMVEGSYACTVKRGRPLRVFEGKYGD